MLPPTTFAGLVTGVAPDRLAPMTTVGLLDDLITILGIDKNFFARVEC